MFVFLVIEMLLGLWRLVLSTVTLYSEMTDFFKQTKKNMWLQFSFYNRVITLNIFFFFVCHSSEESSYPWVNLWKSMLAGRCSTNENCSSGSFDSLLVPLKWVECSIEFGWYQEVVLLLLSHWFSWWQTLGTFIKMTVSCTNLSLTLHNHAATILFCATPRGWVIPQK